MTTNSRKRLRVSDEDDYQDDDDRVQDSSEEAEEETSFQEGGDDDELELEIQAGTPSPPPSSKHLRKHKRAKTSTTTAVDTPTTLSSLTNTPSSLPPRSHHGNHSASKSNTFSTPTTNNRSGSSGLRRSLSRLSSTTHHSQNKQTTTITTPSSVRSDQGNSNLRRKSLHFQSNSSPAVVGINGGGTPNSMIYNDPDENDDELEKRQNKKRREHERRRKSIFASNTNFISATASIASSSPASASSKDANGDASASVGSALDLLNAEKRANQATHTLTSSQLDELFQNCIKLSTENKINVKNTWSLNLIDYIDEVITSSKLGENEVSNFQVASCTLDASVKIYSCRVDSVHTETYKVLGGLSRAEGKGKRSMEDDEESGDAENTEDGNSETNADGTQKKATRKRQHGSNTLESDINNLNVKKFEHAYSIEPLYYRTSGNNAQHDVGSADSLLLNNLYMSQLSEVILDATKYRVVLESGQKEMIDYEPIITPTLPEQQVESDNQDEQAVVTDDAMQVSSEENTEFGGQEVVVSDEIFNVPIMEKSTPGETHLEMEAKCISATQQPETTQMLPTQGIENSQHEDQKVMDSPAVAVFSRDLIENTLKQRGEDHKGEDHQMDSDAGMVGFGGEDMMMDMGDLSDGDDEEGLLDADFNTYEDEEMTNTDGAADSQVSSQQSNAASSQNPLSQLMESDQLDLANQYSFIDQEKVKGNNWAGANLWTFSSTRSKRGKSKTTTKKRKKTNVASFDFTTEPYEVSKKAFEVDKTEKKSSISIAERTIKTSVKKTHLLPEDVHYDISSLQQPFLLPNMASQTNKKKSSKSSVVTTVETQSAERTSAQEVDEDDADGDAMIGGGDVGFDLAFGGDDLFADDDDDSTSNIQPGIIQPGMISNPNLDQTVSDEPMESGHIVNDLNQTVKLAEAPRIVEKLNIKYATRAKKVDVKALKDHLWQAIEKEEEEASNDKEEDSNTKHFSSVVTSLREVSKSKSLPNRTNNTKVPDFSDVSVPFCFICLLHLANEKGLVITGTDLSDFTITYQ